MSKPIDQEYVKRLRQYLAFEEQDISDRWVQDVVGNTVAGAAIKLVLELERLWKAIKEAVKC